MPFCQATCLVKIPDKASLKSTCEVVNQTVDPKEIMKFGRSLRMIGISIVSLKVHHFFFEQVKSKMRSKIVLVAENRSESLTCHCFGSR